LIAETGCEDEERPGWLRYVCEEVQAAMASGVPLEGICLYPIVNHPGWDNDRHCHNGVWDYANDQGHRQIYQPLANEILWWSKVFETPREPPGNPSGTSVQTPCLNKKNGVALSGL
jgi:hypothetical protein